MTRWKLSFALMAGLLLGVPYGAWAIQDHREFTLQNAAAATANGAVLPVEGFTSVGLDITITGTATVSFEGSVAGTGWTAVTCISASDTNGLRVTTATASGLYQCNVAGLSVFHAPVSAFTSGTVSVFGRATDAILGGGAGGGSISGTVAIDQTTQGVTNGVSLTTQLACEDQTNLICMIGGGKARITTFASVTSATSSATTTVFTGPKTFIAQITNATSETKAATLTIYGNWTNSTTGAFPVCTITLPSTATVTHLEDQCPTPIFQNYMFWFYTASVYTSASAAPLTVYAIY